MKTLTFTLLAVAIGIFSACNNSNQEIDSKLISLQHENDSLKSELNKLNHMPEACQLTPIAHFLNFNVKKGDSAELFVSMAKLFNKELPKVIIWNEKLQNYTDTFPFKSESGTFDYIKFPALTKGEHWIKGKVEYQCGEKKRFELFETMYFVE